MEGVTDPCFRAVLLARHRPEDLGGACTEFLRVVDHPYRPSQVRRHLGPSDSSIPVGVQLMGSHESALAATAESVLQTEAAFLDLNFGCPTKGALKGCAGSALLREPKRLESIVRACVEACGASLPVTAKIRAGFDDAESVEELAQAAEAGGPPHSPAAPVNTGAPSTRKRRAGRGPGSRRPPATPGGPR